MATSQGTYKGVNITPGSDADIAKQMAAIDSGTTGTQTAQLGTQAYSQQLLQQAQQLLNTPKAPAPITPTTTQNPPAPYTAPGYTTPTSTPPDMNTLITQANSTLGYDPNEAKTLQDKEAGILGDIKGILDHQGTQSAREAELQNQLGVPELNKNLTEIQNQIRALNAEAFQQVQNQEGRQAPMFGIVGEQERIQRLNSARQYGLAATAQVMQGSLALAQDNIARAIKAEFGADESKLNYQKLLFDLNRDKIQAADSKKYKAIEMALKERDEQLAADKQNAETKYGLALQARQGGAPNDVINSIMEADDMFGALQAAGDYLAPETVASVQEYKFAVKNGYKGSYTQYQNEDANRKIAIARAGVGTTGLTTQQYGALNSVTTKFQADPIINQAVKGTTANAIADQVLANPSSATNQLKSLYVLVKNLDADSAVREGELALAQQTQSYFQRFASSIARIETGQVISPQAATELAQATKELVSAWNQTAQKRQKQYTSQAKVLGLENEFNAYIQGSGLNYNTPQKPTQGMVGTLPNGTQVTVGADGKIRDAQGNLYDENGNRIYVGTGTSGAIPFGSYTSK